MKKVFFLAMVLCGVFSYSQSKQNKVRELISLSGVFPLSKEVEKDVILNYKKKYSHVPESAWEPIEKKINVDELINNVVEIYGSKFSEKEIEQLLIFYKSDLGKKVIHNSPSIMTEIQKASSDWAVKVMEIINGDLTKMGYLQSPPPPLPSSNQ